MMAYMNEMVEWLQQVEVLESYICFIRWTIDDTIHYRL